MVVRHDIHNVCVCVCVCVRVYALFTRTYLVFLFWPNICAGSRKTQGSQICPELTQEDSERKDNAAGTQLVYLEHYRRTVWLGMLCKINSSLEAVKCPLLKQQLHKAWHTHTSTFERIPCQADYCLNLFFPRMVRDWNTLPPGKVADPSLGTFDSKVSKLQQASTPLPC